MRVDFCVHEAGGTFTATSFEMDVIPRAEESVTLAKDGQTRTVHSVEWITTAKGAIMARVMLYE